MKQKTKPNRLINEKSPYLQQHAYNPVDWYPWGEEAFARSRSEDKPILLSIGYSTCHWCHVMEEESFTDPSIARIMNENFVCIKVDREERPDLDKIYMTAVSALTGSGGWPLNVFLTPERKPFFGGTYFPPVKKSGILAWPDLLNVISAAWQNPDKRQKLLASGDELATNISAYLSRPATGGDINPNLIHKAYDNLALNYDQRTGGFSPAPKFPTPSIQSFLMTYSYFCENEKNKERQRDQALLMSNFTLRAMARGGIYDHIGGGFHRYSTDAGWHVPHFEKMLYDNAQLISNYVEAYQMTQDRFFADVATETVEYVLTQMAHPEGGFYSAEDADSPLQDMQIGTKDRKNVEGAFYVWEQKEIDSIIGSDKGEIFAYRYGLKPDGNVEFDPHGDFKGKNILFIAHSLDDTAQKFGMTRQETHQLLATAKKTLLSQRNSRAKPHLDDKILTSWNGLMISALARAYQVMKKETYLDAARKAAYFVKDNLYDPDSEQLYRRWRQGERKVLGVSSDYAFLIQGLIDLYEADYHVSWLEWAIRLTERQIDLFYDADNGGFYMTSANHDKNLIMRAREESDSALPSDNSVSVLNLLRLTRLTHAKKYQAAAEKTLTHVLSRAHSHPESAPMMLIAYMYSRIKPIDVIITGGKGKEDTRRLLEAARSRSSFGKTILLVDNESTRNRLAEHLPFISSFPQTDGQAAAHVCVARSCQLPVFDPETLAAVLSW